MASKNHEELATIMVKDIMEARDNDEYRLSSEFFSAIGLSIKYATERSRLECDIRRFVKYDEPCLYYESDIERMMQDLSEKLGRPVHFRTRPLWECLVSKLSEELQNNQDQWQTAKIIYSLGLLYDDNEEKISNVVYSIKDDMQRRNAVICTRVYFDGYEKVFDFFKPDTEI